MEKFYKCFDTYDEHQKIIHYSYSQIIIERTDREPCKRQDFVYIAYSLSWYVHALCCVYDYHAYTYVS